MFHANLLGRTLALPAVFGVVFALFVAEWAPPARAQVESYQKISDTQGDFTAILHNQDRFGISIAPLGDFDGDVPAELAVGAYFYPYTLEGPGPGAVFVLSLFPTGTVKSHVLITSGQGGFTGVLDNWDDFGRDVTSVGDRDADGVTDLAVGASSDDDGGFDRGAIWLLFMNSSGTVKSHRKISSTCGGFTGILDNQDFFGSSVAWLGDINGDGTGEIAIGAREDDDGGTSRGAVWIVSLDDSNTVASHVKISSTSGGFTGGLGDGDNFGIAVAALGDLDGDSVPDLAVAAHNNDTGGVDRGSVWILFLNSDGTVKGHQKIASGEGGFSGNLDDGDNFGAAVGFLPNPSCAAGGRLAVGAIGDDDGGTDRGAVWLLGLAPDGTVRSTSKISDTEGGFTGTLDNSDFLGKGVQSAGDVNGDGAIDLCVGATRDDDGGADRGAAWVMFLSPAAVEPSTVAFDSVPVGKPSRAQFSILNLTCQTLTGDITESCQDFSIVEESHYEIAPLDSVTVMAEFVPSYSGEQTCVVDLDNGLLLVMSGFGLESDSPFIFAVSDVGNDQGRRVRLEFARSGRDAPGSPTPVLQYEAYRRIDPLPDLLGGDPPRDTALRETLMEERATRAIEAGMISAPGGLLAEWEFAGAIPAHGDPSYFMIAPTLADSTVEDGVHWSVFFVRAATASPVVYFDSAPDSGYSLDNLSPNVPTGFSVAYNSIGGNALDWQPSLDTDFRYFNIYRDMGPGFTPAPENLVHQTVEHAWVDPVADGWQYTYKLTAVDFAGNESDAATPGNVTGAADAVPERYALYANVPNPFNPSTMVRYDVPIGGGNVVIEIFDSSGKRVCTLTSGYESSGARTAVWRGTNDAGEEAASGVYFCRMKAPGFVQTRKIVLLR